MIFSSIFVERFYIFTADVQQKLFDYMFVKIHTTSKCEESIMIRVGHIALVFAKLSINGILFQLTVNILTLFYVFLIDMSIFAKFLHFRNKIALQNVKTLVSLTYA